MSLRGRWLNPNCPARLRTEDSVNACERNMIEIRPAELPRELAQVRGLFRDYADGLGIDLGFQDFETELATLPGKYAAPAGRLQLAWSGTEAVGCAHCVPSR